MLPWVCCEKVFTDSRIKKRKAVFPAKAKIFFAFWVMKIMLFLFRLIKNYYFYAKVVG
jgi:hypothetical protein